MTNNQEKEYTGFTLFRDDYKYCFTQKSCPYLHIPEVYDTNKTNCIRCEARDGFIAANWSACYSGIFTVII